MKKKSLEDDVFNAVLEQAFTEAVAEEFADVPAVVVPSQVLPKKKRPKRKWIVCVGLLIAVVGVVLLILLAKVGSDGYSVETPEYVFEYIPEDYSKEKMMNESIMYFIFKNTADDTFISISYDSVEDSSLHINNEQTTTTECTVNGYTAYLTYHSIDNSYTLIWSDCISSFAVSGTVPKNVLLKIAENIVRKPQ